MMKTVAESCQRKAWLGEWLVLKEVKEMAAWDGIMSKRCLCYFPWEVCVCDETKLCGMWPEWANMHCVQALPGLIPGGSKSLLGSSGRGVHCNCISCHWCGWDGEGLWELHVPIGSLSWSWALLIASAGCWLPRAKVRAVKVLVSPKRAIRAGELCNLQGKPANVGWGVWLPHCLTFCNYMGSELGERGAASRSSPAHLRNVLCSWCPCPKMRP